MAAVVDVQPRCAAVVGAIARPICGGWVAVRVPMVRRVAVGVSVYATVGRAVVVIVIVVVAGVVRVVIVTVMMAGAVRAMIVDMFLPAPVGVIDLPQPALVEVDMVVAGVLVHHQRQRRRGDRSQIE